MKVIHKNPTTWAISCSQAAKIQTYTEQSSVFFTQRLLCSWSVLLRFFSARSRHHHRRSRRWRRRRYVSAMCVGGGAIRVPVHRRRRRAHSSDQACALPGRGRRWDGARAMELQPWRELAIARYTSLLRLNTSLLLFYIYNTGKLQLFPFETTISVLLCIMAAAVGRIWLVSDHGLNSNQQRR